MFEQIAGQSVSDISPSPATVPNIDKRSPDHEEEDNHPIRGIFTHFKNNEPVEIFGEEQLDGTELIDLEKNITDQDQIE